MRNRHLLLFFSSLVILVCAISLTAGGGGVRWKTVTRGWRRHFPRRNQQQLDAV